MKDCQDMNFIIKCVWVRDHPVTATQIQQILLKKYQTDLTADHSERLCTALIRRAMST